MTRLSDPVSLGRREARNRIVLGPHETNLGRRRALSDRHVAYYRARADGGTGVIVTEEASVHGSDWPYERSPLASECDDGWRAISAACHAAGALVIAALGHSGGQGSSAYHQRVLWAPSRSADVESREVAKEMEADEIDQVVTAFSDCSRAAMDAGCDGVELNAGQYSLIRQFLSGLTNSRTDRYGTDRVTFGREVVRSAREAVGDGILGLRLSCDELAPWAGIVPEQGASIASRLAGEGLDYVVVVRGSAYGTFATRPDAHVEPGFNRGTASLVREVLPVGVALVAQGSIVDAAMGEELLAGGECDLVEMTRAQIADPHLGRKVARRAHGRIRPCVLCNQTCRVRDPRNPIVTCIAEPRSGFESVDPVPPEPETGQLELPDPAALPPGPETGQPGPETGQPVPETGQPVAETGQAEPRLGQDSTAPGSGTVHVSGTMAGSGTAPGSGTVLVVGGGPAGLEAARVAALLGHSVVLAERADQLGGMVLVAARRPSAERFAVLAAHLESECRLAGVEVVTGHEVSLEEIDAHDGPVLYCTGSRSGRREYELRPGAAVATAAEVLAADRHVAAAAPSPVVVWDPVGGPVGIGVAELLSSHGAEVTLVTCDFVAGQQLSLTGDIAPANVRLAQRGIEIVRRSIVREVGPDVVVVEDRFSGDRRSLPVALCVDAGHRLPEDTLWRAAGASGPRAGDAVAPRTVLEAVREGRRLALGIGARLR